MKAAAAKLVTVTTTADFDLALATNPQMTAAGSRFSDETWDLTIEMAAVRKTRSEKRLDFRMQARGGYVVKYAFPQDKGLADYPVFHTHAKRLLAAMILTPRNRLGPVFSATTLIHTVGALRRIYTHLVAAGHADLESVPVWTFESYTQRIASYPASLLGALRLIHLYRDLAPAFTFDPWRVAIATPAAQASMAKRYQQPTEPIPDAAFRQLVQVCVSYVEDRSGAILDARELLASARAERRTGTGFYPGPGSLQHRKLWDRIDLAKIFPEHAGAPADLQSVALVHNACRHLQTAAVALLFAITGMRLNELLTAQCGCVQRTVDGTVERIWIESMHSKYADRSSGDRARWLCGPIGEKAVAVLTRLSEPTRRESRTHYLIGPLAEHGRHRIKNARTAYRGGSANTFFSPKLWWARFLRDHHIGGADDKAAHIHAHQFRRTFARWCALSDSSTSLLALKDHFKHASILMTRHYAQIDDELLLLFELEKDRICAESFDKVLRAEALGGIGGHLIKNKVTHAIATGELPPNFRGVAGARVRADCIRNWLQSGVQMRACAGHYCVPIDPHVACGETESMGCNKGVCRNAVFHPEHAPGLSEKIRNDQRALDKLHAWTPAAPYVEQLREHVRVQEKILADITVPLHGPKTDERA